MAFSLLTAFPLSSLSSITQLPLFKSHPPLSTLHSTLMIHPITISTTIPNAIGPDGKYYPTPLPNSIGSDGKYYNTPSDDDPPEAPEDTQHGVSIYEKINRRKNPLKQGLLPPNPRKDARFLDPAVELTPKEVMDLDEISELEGIRVVSEEEPTEDNPSGYGDIKVI